MFLFNAIWLFIVLIKLASLPIAFAISFNVFNVSGANPTISPPSDFVKNISYMS